MKIRITIEGGIIQAIERLNPPDARIKDIPAVPIEVWDFDTDDAENEVLFQNDNGEDYILSVW